MLTTGIPVILLMAIFVACHQKGTDNQGIFDIYARAVYKSLPIGSSAECYLYHNGYPIFDATIIFDGDTISLADSSTGYYRKSLQIGIADTLEYSIDSEYGFSSGLLVIPDTARLISPANEDTIIFGSTFRSSWNKSYDCDGYYGYLENQDGYVAGITESYFDTLATVEGGNYSVPGDDRFWIESLKGEFKAGTTPDGRKLPLGVVGASGTFSDVYIGIE